MRDIMLFMHFLGLILGIGSGFSSLFIGLSNKNISKEEGPAFMLRLRVLGYMGLSGMILLILSGGYLATPYWSNIKHMPWFIAKLSLVVLLLIILIRIDKLWRNALRDGGGPSLKKIPPLGRLALPISVLILLFAIMQFH
jgi:uncharacterized membrane protein